MTVCTLCDKEFIPKDNRKRTQCPSCAVSKRRWKMKIKLVKYLGGKCNRCGYCEHPAALQFHHKNPDEKKFVVSANKLLKSFETIVKEVDKCELLCANCHAVEHSQFERFQWDHPDLNWDRAN